MSTRNEGSFSTLSCRFWTLLSVADAAAAAAVDAVDEGEWLDEPGCASRQNRTSMNPTTAKTRYDPISFNAVGDAHLTETSTNTGPLRSRYIIIIIIIIRHSIECVPPARPNRRRRFRIDTEVRCVGAHPLFWPFEPARVKPN